MRALYRHHCLAPPLPLPGRGGCDVAAGKQTEALPPQGALAGRAGAGVSPGQSLGGVGACFWGHGCFL